MYLRKTFSLPKMIKSLIVSSAVVGAAVLASPAQAESNFYVNPEYNAGWSGSSFVGGTLDAHVGFESGAFYIQGGPSILMENNVDAEVGYSAKTGIAVPVSDSFDAYGEFSLAKFDSADGGYGLKLGGKYKF